MYNVHQLTGYAKKFLKETYNLELTVPIELNGRMSKTCGWFKHARNRVTGEGTPVKIEMNRFFVENNDPVTVLDVLRHELVHYALYIQKKPHTDGHPIFERELKRLGIVSQSTIDKYEIKSKPVRMNEYKCDKCGIIHQKKRALPNEGRGYGCSCGGKIISLGKVLVKS